MCTRSHVARWSFQGRIVDCAVMEVEIEEKLISLVENNPVLYDKTLSAYKSPLARDNAWLCIGKELNTDVERLKKRWRTLRDAFIKNYRIVSNSESGLVNRNKRKRWCYYDRLMFLIPHMEIKENEGYDSEYKLDENPLKEEDFLIPDMDNEVDHLDTEFTIAALASPSQDSMQSFASTSASVKKAESKIMKRGVDPDEQFLLSCLPILKRLSHRKNMLARIRIQQLLFDIEFDQPC